MGWYEVKSTLLAILWNKAILDPLHLIGMYSVAAWVAPSRLTYRFQ